MHFRVPQAGSNICHFEVSPVKPARGKVQPWKVVEVCPGNPQSVDSFDMEFSRASSARQRMSETMTLVFTISDDVQTADEQWQFSEGGAVFCLGQADFLGRIQFSLSDNNATLTATVRCLSDLEERFDFFFVAMCRDGDSGICTTYSSPDPGGSVVRKD